jgi:protein-disulfide isomerase
MPVTMNLDRRSALLAGLATLLWNAPLRAAPAGRQPLLLGSPTAPKRFVLWGSLTCPFTAVMVMLLGRMQSDMPAKMAVEWHHFPTHSPDPALHVRALAGEGRHFWPIATEVLKQVYADEGRFSGLTSARMTEIALSNGAKANEVEAAIANPALWDQVKQDFIGGKLMGIRKTPGLFFNGYFLTPDGIPVDLAAFDRELRSMINA